MYQEITKVEFDALALKGSIEKETDNGYLYENIIDSDGNEIGYAVFNHNDYSCPKYYSQSVK